ncbi:hypothetical protein [Nocardia thailandica]|uniref:hypothetical protein n=1 Tax=Nocardia thailandica TaxID=257275 RepID=UPI0002D951AA|nr:hypothetical protein [Nocardia thailandica]
MVGDNENENYENDLTGFRRSEYTERAQDILRCGAVPADAWTADLIVRLVGAARECARCGIPIGVAWTAAEEGFFLGDPGDDDEHLLRLRVVVAESIFRGYGSADAAGH